MSDLKQKPQEKALPQVTASPQSSALPLNNDILRKGAPWTESAGPGVKSPPSKKLEPAIRHLSQDAAPTGSTPLPTNVPLLANVPRSGFAAPQSAFGQVELPPAVKAPPAASVPQVPFPPPSQTLPPSQPGRYPASHFLPAGPSPTSAAPPPAFATLTPGVPPPGAPSTSAGPSSLPYTRPVAGFRSPEGVASPAFQFPQCSISLSAGALPPGGSFPSPYGPFPSTYMYPQVGLYPPMYPFPPTYGYPPPPPLPPTYGYPLTGVPVAAPPVGMPVGAPSPAGPLAYGTYGTLPMSQAQQLLAAPSLETPYQGYETSPTFASVAPSRHPTPSTLPLAVAPQQDYAPPLTGLLPQPLAAPTANRRHSERPLLNTLPPATAPVASSSQASISPRGGSSPRPEVALLAGGGGLLTVVPPPALPSSKDESALKEASQIQRAPPPSGRSSPRGASLSSRAFSRKGERAQTGAPTSKSASPPLVPKQKKGPLMQTGAVSSSNDHLLQPSTKREPLSECASLYKETPSFKDATHSEGEALAECRIPSKTTTLAKFEALSEGATTSKGTATGAAVLKSATVPEEATIPKNEISSKSSLPGVSLSPIDLPSPSTRRSSSSRISKIALSVIVGEAPLEMARFPKTAAPQDTETVEATRQSDDAEAFAETPQDGAAPSDVETTAPQDNKAAPERGSDVPSPGFIPTPDSAPFESTPVGVQTTTSLKLGCESHPDSMLPDSVVLRSLGTGTDSVPELGGTTPACTTLTSERAAQQTTASPQGQTPPDAVIDTPVQN